MHTIEKKARTTSAPGGKNYDVSVGCLGYLETTVGETRGLRGLPEFRQDEKILIIEQFYNYLAAGSINDRRNLFVGCKIENIGAVLLKKLSNLALLGENSRLGLSKVHEYIYVVGAKRQAWENYKGYKFLPIGNDATTWRANTRELHEIVKGKKVVTTMLAGARQPAPPGVKVPSLFSMALNAATTGPGAPVRTPGRLPEDPVDPALVTPIMLSGVVDEEGFVVV
jgi:hypothetical protein